MTARICSVLQLIAAGISVALTGCASMSGLDASSSYSCKAPEGVKCDSVSGTYYNALQNNLPAQRSQRIPAPGSSSAAARPSVAAPASGGTQVAGIQPISMSIPEPGASGGIALTSLHSPQKILRMWIKPWEDNDGDLFDQSYLYVQVDQGRWLIDHAQRKIRDAYAPVTPPRIAASAPARDSQQAAAASQMMDAQGAADKLKAMQALQRSNDAQQDEAE
jgi:conjugal transfer pilus assembly protein TraV